MKKYIFLVLLLIIPVVYAQSCYDSDNGLNYYTKGYVKFDNTTYYDNCINNQTLIEGYCIQQAERFLFEKNKFY